MPAANPIKAGRYKNQFSAPNNISKTPHLIFLRSKYNQLLLKNQIYGYYYRKIIKPNFTGDCSL